MIDITDNMDLFNAVVHNVHKFVEEANFHGVNPDFDELIIQIERDFSTGKVVFDRYNANHMTLVAQIAISHLSYFVRRFIPKDKLNTGCL